MQLQNKIKSLCIYNLLIFSDSTRLNYTSSSQARNYLQTGLWKYIFTAFQCHRVAGGNVCSWKWPLLLCLDSKYIGLNWFLEHFKKKYTNFNSHLFSFPHEHKFSSLFTLHINIWIIMNIQLTPAWFYYNIQLQNHSGILKLGLLVCLSMRLYIFEHCRNQKTLV